MICKCGHPDYTHNQGKCEAVKQKIIKNYKIRDGFIIESEVLAHCNCIRFVSGSHVNHQLLESQTRTLAEIQ